MNMELLKKAEEMVSKHTVHGGSEPSDYVMALIDDMGYPNASTITASKADGFKWIAFCTGLYANKPNRIRKDPRASIYLFDKETFTGISLMGRVEIITAPDVKREMWNEGLANHFKDFTDENYCVLKFIPERYNIFIDYQQLNGEF